ncbi:EF hand family protein [Histomonas meleagridis]|uniref:EF hand family protein n=1 Tax=Histomonas meleagridis TaxID=135588 RepID=UPI003559C9CD|nr:EF hand family protein [Histomonas meleagridis]KAH0804870.1 EF hand family protein [Histomonas meleagridis]
MDEEQQKILSRIKEIVTTHSIDVEKELGNYDRKQTGVISSISLHRWISSLGLSLDNQQIRMLADYYSAGPGVDIQRFVQDLNQALRPVEIRSTKLSPCVNELRELNRILSERYQTIREAMKPYDKLNVGKVTIENFYRAVGGTPSNKMIVRYYADTITGLVDYLNIQNDLLFLNEKSKPQSKEEDLNLPPYFEQIVRYVRSHGIEIRSLFSRSDPGNTGYVSSNIFFSTISSLGRNLSPDQIQEIVKCFSKGNNRYSYMLLLKAISNYDLPPLQTTTAFWGVAPVPEKLNPQTIIKRIQETVQNRHIDIAYYFEPLRQENPTSTTKSKFHRVISNLGLGLTGDDIDLLCTMFPSPYNSVNYQSFIDTVSTKIPTKEYTTEDIITRLKKYLLETKQQLSNVIQRFDRENSGEITLSQLTSAFNFVRFEILPQELNVIYETFPGKTNGTISWQRLCKVCDPKHSELPPNELELRTMQLINTESIPTNNLPPKQILEILIRINKCLEENGIDLNGKFHQIDRQY